MKRKVFSTLFLLLTTISSLVAADISSLVVGYCSMGKYQINSFSFILFAFKDVEEEFTILGDSTALLYCDGEVVATGKFTVPHSRVHVMFDPIMLPKGKVYQFQLPAGLIALKNNKEVKNEEYNITFEVPEYLPTWGSNPIKNGATVVSASYLSFDFKVETKDNVITKMILYREGIPVREIPASSGWDWDLGYVQVSWDNKLYFEKGVNYSFVLPEGSICAMYRDDIVNKEERVDFVGGSDKSFPELKHSWCNLDGVKTIGALNEVQWIYNSKVALSLAPSIELRNEAGELLKSVVPTLTENEGKWILSADFEGYTINPAETYHLILPESTVVTPSGDVVVNKRSTIRIVKGETGIDDVTDNNISITCVHNQVRIEGTTPGDHIALYTVAGSAIATLQADGCAVTLDLPQPGIYVVVVNSKAHKVVNR